MSRRSRAEFDELLKDASPEVRDYMERLRKTEKALRAKPPRDGWSEATLAEARAYWSIILDRLSSLSDTESQ